MILDEIAEKTRARVEEDKKQIPFFHMRNEAERLAAELPKGNRPKLFPFYQTLKSPGISFICEVKKASPSKGVIAEEFPYLEIAKEYEIAGASAISCLTEPYYFQGKDMYLKEITQHVTIPVLRKDFTIDPYMIYQARTLGASAILLICSLIGVNNRDLKTFTVDINNSARYRKMVPKEVSFVSESGIKTAEDIAKLLENGTDAVLIGETLMRSENKKQALDELRGM